MGCLTHASTPARFLASFVSHVGPGAPGSCSPGPSRRQGHAAAGVTRPDAGGQDVCRRCNGVLTGEGLCERGVERGEGRRGRARGAVGVREVRAGEQTSGGRAAPQS